MQRQIRKSLLGNIRMLVSFVRADRVQRLYTEDPNNRAKYIGLLQIQIY